MPLSFFTNSGNSYGSAIPFQRIVEPAQLGFFLNLEQAELLRIQRYNEHWRFYYGKHWNFTREDGEPLVTFNYYKKFIDKHAYFMVGKGFSNIVHPALEEVTKPYLDEVWDYNNRDKLVWDIAIMGGVSGDDFVLVTEEEPSELQKKINPFSQGRTRINLLGSEQVYPTWDPLNHETLTAVRVETIYYAERGVRQLDRDDRVNHQGRQLYTKRFTQIITANQILEQFQGQVPVIKQNPLGEIPLIHWPNISVPKEYYGLSDGHDLVDLNRELNEKSTDISDVVNYHASPVTVITGAKAKNLERGPKMIWSGLPAEARVFNLELSGNLPAAQTYRDTVKRALHEIGDVAEGSLGQMQPISNTSGVALHMSNGPMIEHRARKLPNYTSGFKQINYFILRIGMMKGRINLPFDICSSCGGRIIEIDAGDTAPVWNEATQDYDFVPRRVKRCFHINKQNLDFMRPEEMRVKVWREYGFGGQIKEVPLDEAKRIAAGVKSYWDYAAENVEMLDEWKKKVSAIRERNAKSANEAQTPEFDENGQEIAKARPPEEEPPPPEPTVKRLPIGDVDVPEEPILVHTSQPLLHPSTGEVVRYLEKELFLVPTGCKQPAYLNPFDSKPVFHDVLPKDEALQASLYQQYMGMGVVDEEWVQDRIPEIAADKSAINKRLAVKRTSGQPSSSYMTAAGPPGFQAPPITDLTPATPPQASIPGKGGNPVAPGEQQK